MNSLSSGSALLSHGVLRVTDSRGSSGSGRDYFRPLAPGAVPDGQRCNLSAESPKQCNAADRQTTRHRNRVSSLELYRKVDLREGLDTNLNLWYLVMYSLRWEYNGRFPCRSCVFIIIILKTILFSVRRDLCKYCSTQILITAFYLLTYFLRSDLVGVCKNSIFSKNFKLK